MKTVKEKDADATKQREILVSVMKRENLNVNSWCKKAGISEGTLRHFLSGANGSMGADKWELLAKSIGKTASELMGGDNIKIKESELTEREVALTDSLNLLIGLLIKKNLTNRREMIELFTHQKLGYEKANQKDSLLVVNEILDFLFDELAP